MKHARTLWIAAFIFGLITALLVAVIFPMFPATGHALPKGYGGAVYAMEMARTPADLIAVFGPEGDPARGARIAAMDKGNQWDYAFMPAYAGFMALFLWAACRETGQKIWGLLACIGGLSGIADAVENVILLGLTKDLAAAPFMSVLAFPVWIKFFAITIAIGASGVFMTRQSMLWRVIGWLMVLSATLTVLLPFYDAAQFGYLAGSGIGFGWIAMIVFAGTRAFKPSP